MEDQLNLTDESIISDHTEQMEILEVTETSNEEELMLLNELSYSLKTTNTLIIIIFIVALSIGIYQLMWRFMRWFI